MRQLYRPRRSIEELVDRLMAALVPTDDDGTPEVVTVLRMRWKPGKLVSRRNLRGLRPLGRACRGTASTVGLPRA